ncbi:hypothetical protein GCM10010254_72730 [Streptomyces chromofuscus]|nr:hypothetical protein GCM10010254_72730 [Streptomyces chromofuscus]
MDRDAIRIRFATATCAPCPVRDQCTRSTQYGIQAVEVADRGQHVCRVRALPPSGADQPQLGEALQQQVQDPRFHAMRQQPGPDPHGQAALGERRASHIPRQGGNLRS